MGVNTTQCTLYVYNYIFKKLIIITIVENNITQLVQ